jgi:hypothetical protein
MYLVFRLRHSKAVVVALFALYLFLPRAVHAAEGQKHKFRLGTAAMPFGWATAVADLDSDQKLDFAIADRTGNGPNGYNYSLQLTLSQAENQVFQFRSPDSALNVSIVDLDDDADLDVVLTHAVSGEIAGVWINNGRGGFRQGNTDDFDRSRLKIAGKAALASANAPDPMAVLPLKKNKATQAAAIRLYCPVLPIAGSLRYSAVARVPGTSTRFITPRSPPASFLS